MSKDSHKQADLLGLGLSAIPVIGGALSGAVNPINGLSSRESAYGLDPYSIAGSVAAPIGLLLAKNPKPFLKQFFRKAIQTKSIPLADPILKRFLTKALVASSLGSATGAAIGRLSLDRSFNKRAIEIYKEAFSLGDAAGSTGKFLYDWFIDPGVQAVKDVGSAGKMLFQGDVAGAGARGMSALGNGLLFGATFIPGVGWGGKAAGGLLKGLGAGAKALKLTEAGAGLARAGKAVNVFSHLPARALRSTPMGYLTGTRSIMPVTKATTWAGRAINAGKHVINTSPFIGGAGLTVGGDLLYNKTRGGKMEQMVQSGMLPDYLGSDLAEQISGLSRPDQIRVYDKLERLGVPGKILGDWAQPGAQENAANFVSDGAGAKPLFPSAASSNGLGFMSR